MSVWFREEVQEVLFGMNRLGYLIRYWRLSEDVSLRAVAKQIGIAPSVLHGIEGTQPPVSIKVWFRLMNWLLEEVEC